MPGVTLLLPVLMTPLKLNIIFQFSKNKGTDSQVIKQSVKRHNISGKSSIWTQVCLALPEHIA